MKKYLLNELKQLSSEQIPSDVRDSLPTYSKTLEPKPAPAAPAPAAPAPAAQAPAAPAPAAQAPAAQAQAPAAGSLGKVVNNNYIICNDPQLIPLEQQYLKYFTEHKNTIIDGKYGERTNTNMSVFLDVFQDPKYSFYDKQLNVQANPDMVCGYIKNDLPKKAGVANFEALKQLVQSKLPPGQKAGVVPKTITANKKVPITPASQEGVGYCPPNGNGTEKCPFISYYDAMRYINTNPDKFGGQGKLGGVFFKQNNQIRILPWDIMTSKAGDLNSSTFYKDLPTKIASLEESWSTRNKNKYTQNLFERLIKDVAKGKQK